MSLDDKPAITLFQGVDGPRSRIKGLDHLLEVFVGPSKSAEIATACSERQSRFGQKLGIRNDTASPLKTEFSKGKMLMVDGELNESKSRGFNGALEAGPVAFCDKPFPPREHGGHGFSFNKLKRGSQMRQSMLVVVGAVGFVEMMRQEVQIGAHLLAEAVVPQPSCSGESGDTARVHPK